jgi:hypothetical protein
VIDSTLTGDWGVQVSAEQNSALWHIQPSPEQRFFIPLQGDGLVTIVRAFAQALTDEQRRELAPIFNGGIILAGPGSIPPRQG